ncbi:hypothetical protein HanRHA438_Chr09g0423551 [Helianthus annuus]|nr:hypothetical protein HanRHA438_Chr09g0423551 [Helianthus annuus]
MKRLACGWQLPAGINESNKGNDGVTRNADDRNSFLRAPMLTWPVNYAFQYRRS